MVVLRSQIDVICLFHSPENSILDQCSGLMSPFLQRSDTLEQCGGMRSSDRKDRGVPGTIE